ncbi:MAG: penicillin-binding protein activator LpoB [Oligoflexia bacterium]|nr:penicillin-binding protein activator LpoB [Oligoflexia bacterium]
MQRNNRLVSKVLLISVAGASLWLSGCGPKAFTKGDYDDPNRVELLDDKFNEADMQQMADTTIKGMVGCAYVANAPKPPVVIVERVQNRTEEHIDTVAMTDMVRSNLIQSGKMRFINKEERGTLGDETSYGESGNVDPVSAKKRGKQIGADYILSGAIATNVQQVGDDKFIYYKLTMNLTNIETSTIDCTQEKQIRKKFRKRSVGF